MAINPTTKPHSLTHISNLSWDDDNQLIVNEIVGVDPNGVVRKVPVTVDGKLAVDATVTATIDPTGLATDTNQTNGSQKTQIVTSGGVTVDTFGGGTQYTEGDTDASITGTAALVEGAADALAVLTQPLTDTQLRATAVPVSATSLPLPTGASSSANQTTIIGHLDGVEGLLTTIDADTGNVATSTASLDTKLPAQGQALMAASTPVVIASNQSAVPVSGTFYQATQPVSVASVPSHDVTNAGTFAVQVTSAPSTTVTATNLDIRDLTSVSDSVEVKQATGTNLHVVVDTAPTTAVTGTFWQATQPVSGTVTANLSATDNAVLDNIDTSTASHYITGVGHGVKTVTTAGTDVVLAASTACKRVDIQAQTDNTGLIAVGGSGVDATVATGTGVLLSPGDIYSLEIDNLTDIYIDSTVSGDGVRYSYFT